MASSSVSLKTIVKIRKTTDYREFIRNSYTRRVLSYREFIVGSIHTREKTSQHPATRGNCNCGSGSSSSVKNRNTCAFERIEKEDIGEPEANSRVPSYRCALLLTFHRPGGGISRMYKARGAR